MEFSVFKAKLGLVTFDFYPDNKQLGQEFRSPNACLWYLFSLPRFEAEPSASPASVYHQTGGVWRPKTFQWIKE